MVRTGPSSLGPNQNYIRSYAFPRCLLGARSARRVRHFSHPTRTISPRARAPANTPRAKVRARMFSVMHLECAPAPTRTSGVCAWLPCAGGMARAGGCGPRPAGTCNPHARRARNAARPRSPFVPGWSGHGPQVVAPLPVVVAWSPPGRAGWHPPGTPLARRCGPGGPFHRAKLQRGPWAVGVRPPPLTPWPRWGM